MSPRSCPKAQCEKLKTVSLLLEAANGCCDDVEATREFELPSCNEHGGGGGDGDGDCPPWNPFCKGWSWCAALYALALTVLFGGAIAVMVATCVGGDGRGSWWR
jgi:hypothetical protein